MTLSTTRSKNELESTCIWLDQRFIVLLRNFDKLIRRLCNVCNGRTKLMGNTGELKGLGHQLDLRDRSWRVHAETTRLRPISLAATKALCRRADLLSGAILAVPANRNSNATGDRNDLISVCHRCPIDR